ncbi:MAG: helix-turn-helix domain-containing protein [Anaerolineales bacterium]|jgi:ACT domain-containing protein
MKAFTKASHVNNALQVIKHMNDGMTVSDACRECGLARSTFYDILKRNPEAIAEIQEIIDAKNREQLGLIILSKTEISVRIL